MTVARGWSAEADRLLDYLEHGIFDAIEKQYLRSLIFAIYLDDQDPNNIVEAYTFNFKYQSVPGSDTPVPIMSLGEDLLNLSLNGHKGLDDPVNEVTKSGKLHTLGDVQKSIKSLIKVLITCTTTMSQLPKQRFVKFKLLYNSNAPASYEPPHFGPGDPDKDRWFFTTHDPKETPEKCSVGSLETTWHGVDVHVASVSGIIPSADDNKAPFSGLSTGSAVGVKTAGCLELRQGHAEAQKRDSRQRKIAWDAEAFGRIDSRDADAEGEIDPDYVTDPNDSGADLDTWKPIGVRDDKGEIIPLSIDQLKAQKCGGREDSDDMDVDAGDASPEVLIRGLSEEVPNDLKNLNRRQIIDNGFPEPTQRRPSQEISHHVMSLSESSSLPPSDFTLTECCTSAVAHGGSTQIMTDAVENCRPEDYRAQRLEMGTQVVPSFDDDPIQSFQDAGEPMLDTRSPRATGKNLYVRRTEEREGILDCDCGAPTEDECCILCEGGCGKWFHIWCMGYHSSKDEKIPPLFKCFRCRIRHDDHFDMIFVQSWYPDLLLKYNNLALFRRAIKIVETYSPQDFLKLIGCETPLANQIFKRLETEGFIMKLSPGDPGSHVTRSKAKTKAGKARQRKNPQKEYVFSRSSKQSQQYLDYFNPTMDAEMALIGFDNLVQESKIRLRKKAAGNGITKRVSDRSISATVPETRPGNITHSPQSEAQRRVDSQARTHANGTISERTKRKSLAAFDAQANSMKKLKTSVAPGIDLTE